MDNELERRFAECRFDEATGTLAGVAIRYGDVAQIGATTETFAPGAFTFRDPILNLQHDRSRPVAREGAGLTLTDTAEALSVSVTFPETPIANEARALAKAGLLRGFSIEFRAVSDTWDGNARTVQEAELHGLALVDKPAYGASIVIAARAAEAPTRRRRFGPW